MHLFHLLGRTGIPLRQLGQLLTELEQELEPFRHRQFREVLGDLRQGRGQVGGLDRGHLVYLSTGTRTALPHSVHEPS